ncbi:SUMF1/EgtB/PvdO family nonheme iron enzyme [Nitrosomonas oligotropha]|uniref:SUMF1/EgtB/PvdO family nonheme iron enzyme n=1 Tax=Nitrosomonas oligotropha TaxID=42354 RepID=UPI00136978F1|nr:SUMF1/EgtB/PvdO family nonheme iron enzyme [Nitrosomonas oligotropha]MXS82930.1 TIR domain-containing protein [Nitrosomonas oligotropha]
MAGNVVTFYSYKGGVGRSFALANVAVILAQWGARVLVVDWDIEAPGLNHYFAPPYTAEMKAGVLDFLEDCRQDKPQSLSAYTSAVELPDIIGHLEIMPAASSNGADYTAIVQKLNWDELYSAHNLGEHLETLRSSWLESFDVVLVDSRTGVTDFSGLTTAQLPDILAFMFTANEQSLKGCADVVTRAMNARRQLPLDRPALLPLPIPARFEQREEYDRAQQWRERFKKELTPFLENWMPQGIDPLKLIDLLTIPYVPRWTFGEDLAAVHEAAGSSGTRTSSQAAGYACETIAALILQKFANVDLLVSSREEYIHAARSVAKNLQKKAGKVAKVYISYLQEYADTVRQLVESLRKMGGKDIEVLGFPKESDSVDLDKAFLSEAESADAYIVVIGQAYYNTSAQQLEIEQLLRFSLRSAKPKTIIPIVLSDANYVFARTRLADFNAIFLDPQNWHEEQIYPVLRRVLDVTGDDEALTSMSSRQHDSTLTIDIFIAYARQDFPVAERLARKLEAQGWTVFLDRQTALGRQWHKQIERALHAARAVVVLWSSASRESDFVLEEAEYGKRKDILFPVLIESVEYPYGFGRIAAADLAGWKNQAKYPGLTELLDSLRLHFSSKTFRDKLKSGGEGPLLTVIPAGRFLMGSPGSESNRLAREGPQHEVTIAQPIALGVYAVTFAEYDRFCEATGRKPPADNDWGRENRPVINVSWHDAQAYCAWLSEQTGQLYRLPSEAEWEYACRAGTQAPFQTGETINPDQANFAQKHEKTLPVGSFAPNAFGLYDMHGNVWEWMQDCWHENYHNAPDDGSVWLEKDGGDCSRRVVRGGSWLDIPQNLRSAFRFRGSTDGTYNYLGFRIARVF